MKAKVVREKFLDFFEQRQHKVVSSAPIVLKNDPTLMFTNAGMNQFKDYFLNNAVSPNKRIADTQKCLRVTGKHNDLEDVGIDSYHHTMFEMLGNWSFGDYFKREAIDWAWELLTDVYGIDKDSLYATVFVGDASDGLEADNEAYEMWKDHLPEERILFFDRKDNFWEMGEQGPCGPCSEIHVDIRSDEEKKQQSGAELVNMDHPQVIEIWNLVFIQFNRKANGTLEDLPEKHIDTGMGFERLCMTLQGKTSNYDTDVFSGYIEMVEKLSGITYTGKYDGSSKSDIAMRVIVDHIRAVCFAIADGEMPSNTGAGYVIRRILRRAVRYYYSFLEITSPLLHQLVPKLAEDFSSVFPELKAQQEFVKRVVLEEEKSFLNTLEGGLKRIEQLNLSDNRITGDEAFLLYDTYGFPIDLTRLIASEKGWELDEKGFEVALKAQQERSRADAQRSVGDWHTIQEGNVVFVGYDQLEVKDARVLKYRTIKDKDGQHIQLVLDKTPFYAEGGGQVGDKGTLRIGQDLIKVLDTQKENDLILHYVDRLPGDLTKPVEARVQNKRRALTENNHTATHLLHAALRKVLGDHVTQKGSLVRDENLRFDFAHFSRMSEAEIKEVEDIVNQKIRENISLEEARNIPIAEAKESGAMMLFGEKYGDNVRMITFDKDYSVELCGGCHVNATGEIGLFKIISETGIAAGVRRIEAITANRAMEYVNDKLDTLDQISNMFKSSGNPAELVSKLQEENKALKKKIESLLAEKAGDLQSDLRRQIEMVNGVNFIGTKLPITDSKAAKTLAYNLEKEIGNVFIIFGIEDNGKAQLMITISEVLTKAKGLHAGNMVRELAKDIKGGGGGQPFFATAGGNDPGGLDIAIKKAKEML
ncbi:alanine--tRNA ligase [Portibacter marinus]|uniref:alanine--tRNA ligase n=1 Tax=Portibacter marinus TaxID=2898660 RepID=UPI001F020EF9|nr:alanine--tRNA ligase [Portibacter marinus]